MLRKVGELGSTDARALEFFLQSELDQLAAGMRQYIDADAKGFKYRNAFEHAHRHADLMQAQCERQPADPATGNKNRHLPPAPHPSRIPNGPGRCERGTPGRSSTRPARSARNRMP